MNEIMDRDTTDCTTDAIFTPDQTKTLVELLGHLSRTGYRFVTPSPETHARVVTRDPNRLGRTAQEILGWNFLFDPSAIDPIIASCLSNSGAMSKREDGLARSTLRVSSVRDRLYLHSAYPTLAEDAVFLGPDTYRFANLIEQELTQYTATADTCVLDMGTGSGAGAIVAADLLPAAQVIATDINPRALALAAVNIGYADHAIELRAGRNLAGYSGKLDIILANPPYISDETGRAYRDGGAMYGAAIAVEMADAALANLASSGRFILYTGSAILGGADPLRNILERKARETGTRLDYREIDPDVFGEELETPAYRNVDRIAVVAAIFRKL